jgi:RNA polymerase sigma factor (sigma-70 family)
MDPQDQGKLLANYPTFSPVGSYVRKYKVFLYSPQDDIQIIVQGCLRNDRRAQEELYKRYYPAFMAICLRYVHDSNDAVEVLNDAFLKIFKQLRHYDMARASLYTWMRKIVINLAIDRFRKVKAIRNREMEWGEADEPEIDNRAIAKMRGEELLHMIWRLPLTTRLVFNLYSVEGYSHGEIGEMLGMSEGTSRWHLSDARRQLKLMICLMETNA